MTGWRLGYVVAPPDLLDTIYRVHRAINGPICSFVQRAGVTALRGPQEWISDFGRVYHKRAALTHQLAQKIPGLHPADPQGAFYLWCRYDADVPAAQVRSTLWERGVAVRSGSEYGASGERHIRISYSVDEAIIERGMAIVDEVMRTLR
jgi:aspartate aminotransferase